MFKRLISTIILSALLFTNTSYASDIINNTVPFKFNNIFGKQIYPCGVSFPDNVSDMIKINGTTTGYICVNDTTPMYINNVNFLGNSIPVITIDAGLPSITIDAGFPSFSNNGINYVRGETGFLGKDSNNIYLYRVYGNNTWATKAYKIWKVSLSNNIATQVGATIYDSSFSQSPNVKLFASNAKPILYNGKLYIPYGIGNGVGFIDIYTFNGNTNVYESTISFASSIDLESRALLTNGTFIENNTHGVGVANFVANFRGTVVSSNAVASLYGIEKTGTTGYNLFKDIISESVFRYVLEFDNYYLYSLKNSPGSWYTYAKTGTNDYFQDDSIYSSSAIPTNSLTGAYINVASTVPAGTNYKFSIANANTSQEIFTAAQTNSYPVFFSMNGIFCMGGPQCNILSTFLLNDEIKIGGQSFIVSQVWNGWEVRLNNLNGTPATLHMLSGNNITKKSKNFTEIVDKSTLNGTTLINFATLFTGFTPTTNLFYKIELIGDIADKTKTPIISSVRITDVTQTIPVISGSNLFSQTILPVSVFSNTTLQSIFGTPTDNVALDKINEYNLLIKRDSVKYIFENCDKICYTPSN